MPRPEAPPPPTAVSAASTDLEIASELLHSLTHRSAAPGITALRSRALAETGLAPTLHPVTCVRGAERGLDGLAL